MILTAKLAIDTDSKKTQNLYDIPWRIKFWSHQGTVELKNKTHSGKIKMFNG